MLYICKLNKNSVLHAISTPFILLLLVSFGGNHCFADEAQPRYVAGTGADSGNCQNVFRPCRTIPYAIEQAGKGDPIRVADGEYTIANADQFYQLAGAVGRIQGSMDKLRDFDAKLPEIKSVLMGVPAENRETFEKIGFRVIADTKGISPDQKNKITSLSKQMAAVGQSHSQTECINNSAGVFPCDDINLLAHLSVSDLDRNSLVTSDIWGFIDLNTGREYAIIGLERGAAFVDISNPTAPVVVGNHRGLSSSWRDIKIYQQFDHTANRWHAYAYITTEAEQSLAIMDLSDLPNSVGSVSFTSDHRSAHNVYIANVDFTYGVALENSEPLMTIAGADLGGGRFRLYSLDNPLAPALQEISNTGYMHDAAATHIRDSRKDSQCSSAAGADVCKVLADFNESSVDIWDVTDAQNAQLLSSFNYPNAGYVHSGWWSEDSQYLFVHDELDELNATVQTTTLRVLDMTNLTDPQLAGVYSGPSSAIDHNGFVRGNRYYMSNYMDGLTVLDISVPTAPMRSAYFKTVTQSSFAHFSGAWGVYPFLPSGTVVVSDINSGLYVFEDNSRQSVNGGFAFSQHTYSGVEGSTLQIEVQRLGGSQGDASISIELLNLSADSNDVDFSPITLNWADGESTSQTVDLIVQQDSIDEAIEQIAVKLSNPTGGATLHTPNIATVAFSDPSKATQFELLSTTARVNPDIDTAYAVVKRSGSIEGEVSVSYATGSENAGSVFVASTGTLTWADGAAEPKTIAIPLLENTASRDAEFELTLHSPVGGSLSNNTTMSFTVAADDNSTSGGGVAPGNKSSGGGRLDWWNLAMLLFLFSWVHRKRLLHQN